MYKKIYKCMMCQEIVSDEILGTRIDVDYDMMNSVKSEINEYHFCQDGNIGKLELIGYKKIDGTNYL